MLDELDEDEDQHDPFEFHDYDDISFSKLLFDPTIWKVQGSNNGGAHLNMPILDDFVQVSNATPPPPQGCTCSNGPKTTHARAINGFHGSASP
jgi:hypothetical protein